jgi:transglutaminase-like putative cysteine protease
VRALAERAVAGKTGDVERAVALYYAIRDGIRYDPYAFSPEPEDYRASRVAEMPSAFCIQKAVLLAAAARAVGIPSRLGFADVRNHLTSPKLAALMGSDLFVYHGYTELHLDGRWVKSTPAFNLSLCEKFRLKPLEFDGVEDSIYHPFDLSGNRHMEYLTFRGEYADVPISDMVRVFEEHYPGMAKLDDGDFDRDVEREVAAAPRIDP